MWQRTDCASIERFFGTSGSVGETASLVSGVLLSAASRAEEGLWGGGTRYFCNPHEALSQIAVGLGLPPENTAVQEWIADQTGQACM
jgi:hypothetical protein